MSENNGNKHIADVAYTRPKLQIYDLVLQGISGPLWGCPVKRNLQHYDENVTKNHLEVGVGTGFFIDKCRFPTAQPRLVLMDPNPDPLNHCAVRLSRYKPTLHVGDVLKSILPESLGGRFDSVGINHVIHCLPGTMEEKGVAFRNLRELLNEGGVVFGATVLGQGVKHNWLGTKWLKRFNDRHVLDNWRDNSEDLKRVLGNIFSSSSVVVVGRTALFQARR